MPFRQGIMHRFLHASQLHGFNSIMYETSVILDACGGRDVCRFAPMATDSRATGRPAGGPLRRLLRDSGCGRRCERRAAGRPSGFVVRIQCEIPLSGDISPDSESCLNNSDQNKHNQLPGGWKIRIIREDLFSGDGFLLRREGWRIF